MAATLYPSLILVFFVVKSQAFKNSKTVFGVHLPTELQNSEAVKQITLNYNKQMKRFLIIFLITPVICLFSRHTSIQFSIWMIWFLAGIFLMNLPYMLANKAVLELKKTTIADTDPQETKTSVLYAELKTVRTVRLKSFLLPLLLSILPVLALFLSTRDEIAVFRGVAVLFALLSPCLYFLARWMDQLPSLVISEDSSVNVAYNRARKNVWKNVWLLLLWCNALVVISIVISALADFHSIGVFLIASIMEAFLCVFSMLRATKKLRQINDRYEPKIEENFDRDDDRYWIFGMFYNNPNDKRTMVEKRFGIGLTANMATKTGKITIWVAILALAWIPFMCIWMIMEDFTPMHVQVKDQAVVCSHLKEDYVIPVDSIQEITLLTVLPVNRYKLSGTGTENMEKGKYNAGIIGGYYSFINPEQEAFILIKAEDKKYLISGFTDAETMEVYEQIR